MYQRQVSFTEAIAMAFRKFATFSGRSSRSEYWWFSLFIFIIQTISSAPVFIGGFDSIFSSEYISGFVSFFLFIPSLSISFRRLHDIGKGGGWIFINLIPLIGNIIYIVWMCKDSQYIDNRFGPVPNVVNG